MKKRKHPCPGAVKSLHLLNLPISLLLTAVSTQLLAGGLYLNEFGTPAMGTAGAGAHALANDASTAFHNPAGMTRVDGEELVVSGGLLNYDMKFDPAPNTPVPGGDGGSATGTQETVG